MKLTRWNIAMLLLPLVIGGCYSPPSSTDLVRLPETDQLSDHKKIELFVESVEKLSGPGYAALARLNANENNYYAALDAIHEAILVEPMNSYYHTLKANFSYEVGDISTAYRESLTAYQLGAKSLKQSLSLAKMGVALSEYSIVDEIIDSLVHIYPSDPQVIYMAARKYEKSGDTTGALSLYRKGIQLDSKNVENKFYLARLLYVSGQVVEAKEQLLDIPVSSYNYNSLLLMASIYNDIEIYDSAAMFYKKTLELTKDTVVYYSLIELYDSLGPADSLTLVLKDASNDFPENKNILHATARELDQQYKFDEALTYYSMLFALDTLDTLVADELAYLQRKIAYLQRKKHEELREEQMIPVQRLTLPSLDSIK